MTTPTLRPRERDALIQSLRSGVTPRTGARHIQVGRDAEIAALDKDLDRIAEGGASFRLIVGEFGSGKTFFLNLLRWLADHGYPCAPPMPAKDGALFKTVRGKPAVMLSRFSAAKDTLAQHATTDAAKISAMGYCFGGAVVLDMARAGLDLKGVAAFHAALEAAVAPAAPLTPPLRPPAPTPPLRPPPRFPAAPPAPADRPPVAPPTAPIWAKAGETARERMAAVAARTYLMGTSPNVRRGA